MTTPAELDDRYGRTPNRTRRVIGWSVVGAVAVGLFGYVAWTTVASSAEAVSVNNLGYEVVDEHTVSIDFQFSAPAGRTVVCALTALDEEFGTVGWQIVEYPTEGTHARHTSQIRTVAEATTGLAEQCWVA